MTDGFVAQTSFALNHERGFEGMIADSSPVHVLSSLAASRKLASVAYSVTNSATYTIVINGTTFSYTADGSATDAEIAAGLVAAVNGGSEHVHASGAATPILVESTIDGDAGDFTISGSNTTATVLVEQGQELGFGKFVCMDERSSDDQAVRLPRQSSDVTGLRGKGVTIADNYAKVANSGAFKANVEVPVMRKGHILVKVEEAVSKGDQPYVRYAAGGNGVGSFRKSTGSTEAAALPSAVYLTAADADGLAVLEINFV
jgi:hypothetical protein